MVLADVSDTFYFSVRGQGKTFYKGGGVQAGGWKGRFHLKMQEGGGGYARRRGAGREAPAAGGDICGKGGGG